MQFDLSARRQKVIRTVRDIKKVGCHRCFNPSQKYLQEAVVKYSAEYVSSLSFYMSPPSEEISLHEFEEIASQRLQLLRVRFCLPVYTRTKLF